MILGNFETSDKAKATMLRCRTVRIGTYKFIPGEEVGFNIKKFYHKIEL